MKKKIFRFCVTLAAVMCLAACGGPQLPEHEALAGPERPASEEETKDISEEAEGNLPAPIVASYYEGQEDPAFDYFKHSSIQRFLAMWVKEETGDIENPIWDLDSFTRIKVLDQDLAELRPDEELHCCAFTDGSGRYGYVIVKYNETDPSMSNCGVVETTPYQFDLRANEQEIAASLRKTDLALSTTTASRVYLFDSVNKRADQVIRFTDDKGEDYLYFYGE